MKIKGEILLFFISVLASLSVSGQSLSADRNLPRDNDRLVIGKRPWFSPGPSGADVMWTLPECNDAEWAEISFRVDGDTVEMTADKTVYLFRHAKDVLALEGFYNRAAKVSFFDCEKQLSVAMAYGDSLGCAYRGEAVYSGRKHIDICGESYTFADASGALVVGNETVPTHPPTRACSSSNTTARNLTACTVSIHTTTASANTPPSSPPGTASTHSARNTTT